MRTALRLVIVAACLGGCGRPANPPAPPDTAFHAPDRVALPPGPLGVSIRRGHALLAATRDSLPNHVGSSLRCLSCHLDNGQQPRALPLTGVYARFPQFRWRAAAVQRLEDRINDCFERSLNGSALAFDDPAMRDIVAYLWFISHGVAVGDSTTVAVGAAQTGDTVTGAKVFLQECARCHGADGAGRGAYPPLWGAASFNIGAGMARINTLESFIRNNMPRDRAGTLSADDARAVAAYVASRPRPDFPGKERDWPEGHRPDDVPYSTLGPRARPAP